MENKYKEGEEVFGEENPSLKLIIRRYVDRIYYCKIKKDPAQKELAYFERQLMSNSASNNDKIQDLLITL
jgi:hypothetical protein